MKIVARTSLALAALAWALASWQALAEADVTEVLRLGYRQAEEILPIVRPLVPEPGVVTGRGSTLVVRGSPATVEELKRVVAELDRAPRNLLVTVRHGISDRRRVGEADAFARIKRSGVRARAGGVTLGPDEGSELAAGVRVLGTRSTTDGRDVQQVRVLEGREAFVRFGESVPLASRSILFGPGAAVQDTIDYHEVTSGFWVRPRLAGERVVLDIAPHRSRLAPSGGGVIERSEAATTVAGRLGEWIPIGGSSNEAREFEQGVVYSTRADRTSTETLFLKVEVIGD